MSRALFGLVSILVILGLVAGCVPAARPVAPEAEKPAAPAAKEEVSEEKIEITWEGAPYLTAAHKGALDALAEGYEGLNPNVDIVMYGVPFAEYWNKLTTEIIAVLKPVS